MKILRTGKAGSGLNGGMYSTGNRHRLDIGRIFQEL